MSKLKQRYLKEVKSFFPIMSRQYSTSHYRQETPQRWHFFLKEFTRILRCDKLE